MAAPVTALRRQCRSYGLKASETMSKFENMEMVTSWTPTWQQRHNAKASGARWDQAQRGFSWAFPRHVPGRGLEYRKFFGQAQNIRPFYLGGPLEAVNDQHRKRHFFNEWDFDAMPSLVRAKWSDAHIKTQCSQTHYVPQLSKAALQHISENIYEYTERKRMWNPYTPHQPTQGPAKLSLETAETLRRQAFLQGIEFPQFPDVQPQRQRDPWEEDEEAAIPEIDNDKLLDQDAWKEINKNMVGMEKKVKAFKDTERKKLWTWKMANLMQQLKRARQEESFISAQNVKLRQKEAMEEREAAKREFMRRTQGGKLGAKAGEEEEMGVDEEFEMEVITKEERKEARRNRYEAARHRPPGTRL